MQLVYANCRHSLTLSRHLSSSMGYTTFWHRAQVLFILLSSVLVFFMGEIHQEYMYVCDDGMLWGSGGRRRGTHVYFRILQHF